METDTKNKGIRPIGFTTLNLNTLANSITYDQSGNNLYCSCYTVVYLPFNYHTMEKFYVHFATFLGMFLWFIIGFIIWIPVLLIGTSNYCYEVVRSSLTGTFINDDTITTLKNKIDMYPRGFRNFELIIKSYSKNHDNN